MRLVASIMILGMSVAICVLPQTAYGYLNNALLTWGDWCLVYGPGTDAACDSPEAIARIMKLWKTRGYTGVYWRSDIPQLDPNDVIRFHGDPLEPMIDLGIRRGVEDTSARFDVLTVARQTAEAEGLQFWVYHPTVYSDGAPPWVVQPGYMPWSFVHRYVYDHNEVLTRDRNGKIQYLVREYAYPGARASKVAEFVYMAKKCGIKNFYASMRTEAAQTEPAPLKADQYGFNKPVVDEMLRIYDVNILTDSRFDINNAAFSPTNAMVQNWHTLRGGYLTQFWRDLRTAMDAIDPNIRIVTAIPGDYVGPELGNWKIDWRTWISEGLIDELIPSTSLQAGWDSTVGKGYLCDPLQGIGVLPVSTYRDYINANRPQTKLIQVGGWEKFGPALPDGTDGWVTFWTTESFDIAWYQRWEQWKKDISDFGYIKFMEQTFDGFQVNSSGYTGAEGDGRYHPELRACPGAWYSLGDGTDAKPAVQNIISHSGNALKLTRASGASGNLSALHSGGIDHTSFQSRVDNIIGNGVFSLEFWLYRATGDSAISIWPQYNGYTDTGLNIGISIGSGNGNEPEAPVNVWGYGHYFYTFYDMPVGQWQKFTIVVNVDAKTYSAYAGVDRAIELVNNMPYTTTLNYFNRALFLPSAPLGNVCYLDDVSWKWTPNLYYTPSRIYTYLTEDVESHTSHSTVSGTQPTTGGAWHVSPTSAASGFFAENMLSFGDGYLSLAATSNNNAFIYSSDSATLRLDPNQTVTVDFDVFLRNGYQAIVSMQKNLTGNVTAAVNPNGKWKCWNGTQYTTTNVNVGYDLWNHVQMVLNGTNRNYQVIVQPCGSLPTLLGTFSWDSGTQPNDPVFLVIKPQGTNGQITYYDNIRITYGPANCPVGDLNNDCKVDFADFAKLAGNWLDFAPVGDLNSDKIVDLEDMQVFVLHWLETRF
jgi:hypothetical protein